ncbi:MAG: DUF2189 domain-containing protein [Hyphomicrobiales bacterium]|nr:DUF2189 domain-containing protein [Hyphomicrobiales bacterium]
MNDLRPSVIGEVLSRGWSDFLSAPWFGLFFGLVYAGGGWAIVTLASRSGFYFLAYPLAAGFALIAPFVAAGVYEVSRTIEEGRRATWNQVFCAVCGTGSRDLGWMALITGFVFFIWMDIAFFTYAIFHGFRAVAIADLLHDIMTTWNGMLFFLTGNLIGAVIALFVYSITVVSFPMLMDREVDFVTAMITSVRVVRRNPATMILWAITIAVLLLISLVTLLAGLVIILPVLGHASWHMYRRAVAPV